MKPQAINRTTLALTRPLDITTLDPTKWIYNPDLSAVENVKKYYWKIDGDSVVEMSPAEKEVVDLVKVPELQYEKFAAVDLVTKQQIYNGFTHASTVFSLSNEAQMNWMRIRMIQQAGGITFPYSISTMDNDEYMIEDEPELDLFFTAMSTKLAYEIGVGRALKDQVKALTTASEVEAWVDPRV